MAKVGVLGAGSWGTALAILLHDNGHDVTVWSIDPKEVEMLSEKREHVSKLPGVHISEEIMITNEMEEAIKGKDFLVLAVPSIFTRSTAAKMKPYVRQRRNQIRSTRTARSYHNARFSTRARIAISRVARPTLINGHYVANFVLILIKSVINVKHSTARVAKNYLYLVF